MSKRRARQVDDRPADSSPQDTPPAMAAQQARQAAATLRKHGIGPPARVLVLCCGYGLQAARLARAGYRVVGVDIRREPSLLRQWREVMSRQPGLRLLTADVRQLPVRGRFDAAVLLNNGLSLFAKNEDAIALLCEVRRLLGPKGLLLLDNVCLHLWKEIAAGAYADGVSEDGLWQMAWQAGRNVFSLRYGDQVQLGKPRPGRSESLYRAWSLDELDLLCRLTGWQVEARAKNALLLVLRPARQSHFENRT